MIAILPALRAAWAWCRKHALAIVAGLAAIGGLVAYLLGRRSVADRQPPDDATRAEGHADVLAEQAQEATRRADDARAEEARLRDLQDRAGAEAAAKAREIETMTADEKTQRGIDLVAARRRRQEGRGR